MSDDVTASGKQAATCLVVGGSSGLGRFLAARFASAGHSLVLVSSDVRDVSAMASDLALRHRVAVRAVALDLAAPEIPLSAIDAALDTLPPLAAVLLAAGMNRADDVPGQSPETLAALTNANHASLCRIVDHCLPRLTQTDSGLIVGFGSIAATRGRTRNAAYSAAKRALQSYFESLRHALAGTTTVAQFYIVGYLDTNLAFGQKTALPRASPQRFADVVYRRRRRDFGVGYHPGFWRPVCALLRALPWFIFRRLSF